MIYKKTATKQKNKMRYNLYLEPHLVQWIEALKIKNGCGASPLLAEMISDIYRQVMK